MILIGVINSHTFANDRPNLDSMFKKKCCLGWREWVKLPKLFKERIMVKVDSGAKTSSLHARNIEIFEKENEEWVKFVVFPKRDSTKIKYELQAKVIETKNIRSSNGKMSIRPVIETQISIGGKTWPIEITLVDRSVMGYRMLLGRTAFSAKFLIDSGKSYILSEKNLGVASKAKIKQGMITRTIEYFRNIKGSFLGNLVETGLAILFILLVRIYFSRVIKNKKFHSPSAKNRFAVYTRNSTLLLLLIAILVIWSNEFKTISIYLMAISVATVLMMREVIKNLHGGFLLTGSRPFKIGDRIKIKDVRGEVIDTNFMTTKVAEVGKSDSKLNGHVITLPNSIFLSASVTNESHEKMYVSHTFIYPLKEEKDWKEKESLFFEVIKDISSSYYEDAKKVLNSYEQVETTAFEPSFSYSFPSPDRVNMAITMLVPTNKKEEVESHITREFLERLHKS